jgi:hypothetical protein
MHLTWCPECKRVSERAVINFIMARECVHVVGIDKRPIYRYYCCARKDGGENFGKAWTPLWYSPGERPLK